jgi:hypothetical protein
LAAFPYWILSLGHGSQLGQDAPSIGTFLGQGSMDLEPVGVGKFAHDISNV